MTASAHDELILTVEQEADCAIDYGTFVVQTYGSFVGRYNYKSEVVRSEQYMDAVNAINPDPDGGGLVITWQGAYVYDKKGRRVLDLEPTIKTLPKDYTGKQAKAHHDFIRTLWGTYLFIYGVHTSPTSMDDLIVEVDHEGNVLSQYSLSEQEFGSNTGATDLGIWKENWIHTNSLDTRYRGQRPVVLVSLRNLDKLVEIYWDTKQVRRYIGVGILEHAHHAKYIWRDGRKQMLVYNNGVYREQTGVVQFDEYGEFVSEFMLPFYSPAFGSSQILPNGNYLVVQGDKGRVHEIDSLGNTCRVMQYNRQEYTPFAKGRTNYIYRTIWHDRND